ncbi:hypothetical protein HYH02_009307 [Chlamydomonas schloesseri]|uniref:GDP-D-glucose phosphorylase 1 n=1 Tax=Chlamydomonas schloesseri TaxID=2026947 RepID=A0A835W9K5_9CHLO|nr:hypothetical protein HYH02_009307 [Chlamydomonas schloesseri]|eukprot:KAG2443234.1 hypothetical protein HYH02_009307 [Chlamydomonas schloesseri]
MAVVADTHMDSLQALLRQSAAGVDAAPATVASCMEAYLPVFAFPATGAWGAHGASDAAIAAPVAKLARIDSMPAVPDYFAEARCDSPPPAGLALPGYGLGVPTSSSCGGDAAGSCGSDDDCGSGGLAMIAAAPNVVPDVPDVTDILRGYSFNDLPLSISGVSSSASPSRSSSGSAAASGASSPRASSPGVVPLMDGGGGFEEQQQQQQQEDAAVVMVVPAAAGAFRKPAANAVGGHNHHHHAPPRRHASDVEFARLAAARRGTAAAGGAAATAAATATADLAVPGRSLLEQVVMSLWEDRADRGMFRYDVSQCASRVLPGAAGYLAQLNEGRATKKRPTEFSADRVMQPFDPARFHFNKAALGEVLFAFQPDSSAAATAAATAAAAPRLLLPSAPVAKATAACGSGSGTSPNLVLINVSPIDHCHVLLVPRVLDCLPQAISPDTALLALQFAAQLGGSGSGGGGSGAFRVGYNSLGAFATINHLHFHAYHLPAALPCERAPTAPLPGALARPLAAAAAAPQSRKRGADGGAAAACGGGGVRVSRLVGYPVRSFVIEAEGEAGLEAVAAVLARAAGALQAANQPFNVIASDGGRRVFLFPQCYAERQAAGEVPEELLDTGVNPASFEIAGHLVLKRAADFEAADEAWAARLLAAVSLSEERFWEVAALCFGASQ